ncbi:hypothetical protein A2239_01140 [Candidatus Uhrbacteria bacterium RIFOXYA2_FULL_40_9]|nr:MAG: hypothetical protein UT94_C0045G0009 [Candidatus Uhrbacteria bacterium GW2011_GWF2_40_263]OGL93776.1 MAG: hypothetical protein A2239_01140 [Candidatus Uhrbacteria bacterium RIFOXYA2_FULL_40_9]OGL97439.1 MAG: hypothetical protein A2332_01265 [Candidatus Uhrbacteria bacterium RIFOXYB2_FULL_41_18]HBK34809.1 hypothetical protein [Candidatus Uhrbacteria bacterium]HCB56115.1 hypothetical protein [Candidatus Uhrbacteria bacterium]
MKPERMGELAYKLLLERTARRGYRLRKSMSRDIHNHAQQLGVETAELKQFTMIALRDLMGKMFPSMNVTFVSTLSDQRRNEIALLVARHELRKESIRLNGDHDRELAELAQAIGENEREVKQLFTILMRELMDELFPAV